MVISAAMKAAKEICLQKSMNGYAVKPIKSKALAATIAEVINFSYSFKIILVLFLIEFVERTGLLYNFMILILSWT